MNTKIVSLIAVAFISASLVSCGESKASSASVGASSSDVSSSESVSPVLTKLTLPLYMASATKARDIDLTLADGDKSLPYISLEEAAKLTCDFFALNHDLGFAITVSGGNGVYVLHRENGATATVDFVKKIITFSDYDQFARMSFSTNGMDVLSTSSLDKEGKPVYIEREKNLSSEVKGGTKVIDLGAYSIPMIEKDGVGYLPLQTVSDFFISCENGALLYNTASVIAVQESFKTSSDLGKLYYSAPTGKKSEALTKFTYDEACLSLDSFYGLKPQHHISDFDSYFAKTGLKESLLSTDPEASDIAIAKLVKGCFADLHSNYYLNSPYLGSASINADQYYAPNVLDFLNRYKLFTSSRTAAYSSGCPGYEEIGDTAYVTFDQFKMNGSDYYTSAPTADSDDTVGVIAYAQNQIHRTGSPVKNVVLDLSCNLGGDIDAAIYTLSWMLGTGEAHFRSTFTEEMTTNSYKGDTNFDHVFDDSDNVTDKKLFCLTSPLSFSCGNFVPCCLQESKKVTMLGQTSGGGTCSIFPISLADGTFYQISGYREICTVKNGSYYDIEQGASPDYLISSASDYYNRSSLTSFVDSLK